MKLRDHMIVFLVALAAQCCAIADAQEIWFERVQATFQGQNLQTCGQMKNVVPMEGETCSTQVKTCFFGEQPCDDDLVWPETMCVCSGGENTSGTWSCALQACPASTLGTTHIPTRAPTPSPTPYPTPHPTPYPTPYPTSMPITPTTPVSTTVTAPIETQRVKTSASTSLGRLATTSTPTELECPGTAMSEYVPLTGGFVKIVKARRGKLCTLVVIDAGGNLKPVARSYHAYEWEASAGPYSNIHFNCTAGRNETCTTELPALEGDAKYQLTTFNAPPTFSSSEDTAARLLERSTFGATMAEIEVMHNGSDKIKDVELAYTNWITNQMTNVPLTSHREYYRSHMNSRFEVASPVSAVTHPCQKGTRYRKYAFSQKDENKILTISTDPRIDDGKLLFLSIDNVTRTVVEGPILSSSSKDDDSEIVNFVVGNYLVCSSPRTKEFVGGRVSLEFAKKSNQCKDVLFTVDGVTRGNPPISFPSPYKPSNVVELTSDDFETIDGFMFDSRKAPAAQEIILKRDIPSGQCASSIGIPGNPIDTVVANYNGELYVHDPRFDWMDNSLEKPAFDGGGAVVEENINFGNPAYSTVCSNVARTFLNEDTCFLSTSKDACAADSGLKTRGPTFETRLENATMKAVYEESGNGTVGTIYMYAVNHLRSNIKGMYPCNKNAKSRWAPDVCSESVVENSTVKMFAKLIKEAIEADDNPSIVVDIELNTTSCAKKDRNKFAFIVKDDDGNCWRNVHTDHLNVYDFTPWTRAHPGGSDPIEAFAKKGNHTLDFPDWHELDRWQHNKKKLRLIGRLGGTFNYYSIPETYRTSRLNAVVGFDPEKDAIDVDFDGATTDSSGTLICGSPNEIANDPELGGSQGRGAFDVEVPFLGTTDRKQADVQKRIVWTHSVLEADDQLRQRVAWALAQILVVSTGDISGGFDRTEMFTTYYDIFVRNAFGNYRDILKEVSYSPVMAQMLTYFESRSTAFEYERTRGSEQFADENFAREIMQLFTTGLFKLTPDGNQVIDEGGVAVQVYNNDDIQEYARVWTGFLDQVRRGNVESDGNRANRIDPMKIDERFRDHFPKMGLDRQYIGDGYPLCADLPKQHFLLKGATYKLLGKSADPLLQKDPNAWVQDPLAQRLALGKTSSLFKQLCGSSKANSCTYAPTVVLDARVPCTGAECKVDSVRVVEVGDGIFYEYERSPCVYQAFYDNAKLVRKKPTPRYGSARRMCADPRTEVATVACCPGSNEDRSWNDIFWGEKTDFATALARCDQKVCSPDSAPTCNATLNGAVGRYCEKNDAPYWTNDDCILRVKINKSGWVAIVHASETTEDKGVEKELQEDTKTFFRVDWSDPEDASDLVAKCASVGCTKMADDSCICDVTVAEQQVFPSTPRRSEVLSSLHIGAFDPTLSASSVYKLWGVVSYRTGDTVDIDTIFEVKDRAGVIQRRRNIKSVVSIKYDGQPLSFRNPVHFMNLEGPEPRDAHHETEAALDQYFYHPNTAPFLAIRFAQRFGISNPSPRYISRIVAAFTSGKYTFKVNGQVTSYGAGEYGDLAAMMACVLLDREARSPILDADPVHGSLKEPLMKIIGVMRSLEFKRNDGVPFINFKYDIGDEIGQMAHAIPSVFSFFLPEHEAPGKVAIAEIVAPEAQQTTGPKIVSLLNGLLSLIKYGLDSCHDGLGGVGEKHCDKFGLGDFSRSDGRLTYKAKSSKEITNELATIMTAGRLSAESRKLVEDEISGEDDPEVAMIKAQALIATSPEFHGTSIVRKTGKERPKVSSPQKSEEPYKAVVYVLLNGGLDSHHMLVPHTCSDTNENNQTVLEQYEAERKTLKFTPDERTRIIDAKNQPCSQFAVHPNLPIVEELYNAGDLAFFVNTGVLNGPTSKRNYTKATKTTLYAHNAMQEAARKTDPFVDKKGTGVLGRMCDKLKSKNFNVQPVSLGDADITTIGVAGNSVDPLIMSSKGLGEFNPRPSDEEFDPRLILDKLNDETELHSSLYGETWSSRLAKALDDADGLASVFDATSTTQEWKEGKMAGRLETASKVILTHKERGTDRDAIYLQSYGWDHHRNMKSKIADKFTELNQALTWFKEEMEEAGLWDSVTLVVTSDFARTLTPNSGEGSDHAWGGNYFIMGGGVRGKRILGEYPLDLTTDGPSNVGRGRLIPTTSWESIWNGVLEWMGVKGYEDLDYCLPNRNATGSELYRRWDLFKRK